MSNALRQENAPTGVNKDEGGQSTLGTQAVPWKDIHTVDLNVQRNVTIQGNLSVTGNTSTVEVQELHTEEPMIRVAKINTSDAVDIGIYGATSTEADGSAGASTEYHGFVRDADDKVWKLFEGNDAAESNGTITLAGGTEGTMQAKLNLPSAGDLKIAGTAVDSTAAELNKLNAVVDGTVAANKALIVDASKNLSGLNDVVLEGNLQAVAVTADLVGNVTGNSTTASALQAARNISVSGDAAGTVSFDGSADVDIALTISQDAVGNSMIANPGFTMTDGTNSALRELGSTLTIQGTASEVEVSHDTNGLFTVGLPASVDVANEVTAATFNGALVGNASSASILENARNLTLDGDVSGTVSFDGSSNVTITTSLDAGGLITVGDGTSSEELQVGDSISIQGTANETEVSYSTSTNQFTVGLPSSISGLSSVSSTSFTGDLTGKADTADTLETARTISLSGDVAGSVSFDGSANVDIAATIQPGSVGNSMLANSGLSVSVDGGAVDVVSLGEALKFSSGTDIDVTYNATTNEVAVALEAQIGSDTTGNASTATALESSRNFSIGSGPVQATAVGFDGTGNVSLTTTIADDQITNDMLANDKLVISVDSVNYDRPLGSTLGFSATNLDLNYSAGTNEVQYGLPATIGSDTTGNAATATALETSRTFSLSGDVAGSVSFDGTGNVDIVSTIQPGAVENSMLQNSTLTVLDDVTSGGTLSLGSSIKFSQTANETEVLYDSVTQTVTFGLPDNITANVTGNATTASALETARTLSVSGDISGSASFDGSANSDLSVTVDSVDLSALQIASEIQEVSTLVDADLFVIKDADGTNSKMSASVVKKYVRDDVLSAGTGVGFASGVISIGQPVATSDSVTFNQVTFGSNAVISEADAEKIDDITNGTALADKALVLDSSKNITGISTLQASSLTDGTATLTSGNMTGLTSLTSGNITVSGDEVFSNNHLILNAGLGQVKIASGDKVVLQGDGGDIDISGDATFSRSVFYAVPSIIASDYPVADGDHILMFDLTSAGANKTITLGNSGQTINTNRVLVVKNIGTANSLNFNSASQIDGATASSTVLAPGEKITLIGTPANGWQSI
jgi:cytoskeletal protein CcmA (bactofilin family)